MHYDDEDEYMEYYDEQDHDYGYSSHDDAYEDCDGEDECYDNEEYQEYHDFDEQIYETGLYGEGEEDAYYDTPHHREPAETGGGLDLGAINAQLEQTLIYLKAIEAAQEEERERIKAEKRAAKIAAIRAKKRIGNSYENCGTGITQNTDETKIPLGFSLI